ncbi:unnamed protein product [Brachionus calyciflorus]|uniref:Uncharacterized protein n=1 Tax=Brachionus calyciflorus TaxID=104777 RepID=A0A814BDK5_9BILA|nr:unnamed protein product [Brachionus calyciflorus]
MNTSKLDTSKSSMSQPVKKEKNIREIYLNALYNNNNFAKNKKKSFTNLADDRNGSLGSSQFLEKEYNIVQRIISDTKALKRVKVVAKPDPHKQIASRYKDPEEYYQEILELKKALKILEENEIVNRTKFEYYENELTKKEQEILNLLDVKKTEEFRLLSDSKADLATLVFGLKQKVFKLEFTLKRKENEYNKLKTDLKTTNLKELKLQNERLRLELSKALMNEKDIDRLGNNSNLEVNGSRSSNSFSEKTRSESQMSMAKKEMLKKNIAIQLKSENHKETNSPLLLPKFGNYDSKITLNGSLKDKIEILDQRETELLNEISRLNQELDKFKIKNRFNKDADGESDTFSLQSARDSARSNRSSRASRKGPSQEKLNEKNQLQAIKKLQSIMRGHIERSNSLKRAEKEKMERRRSKSRSPSWRTPSPKSPRFRTPSPRASPVRRSPHFNRKRTPSPDDITSRRSPVRRSPIPRRNSPPVREQGRRSATPQRRFSSSSDDDSAVAFGNNKQNDKKNLIEKPQVDEAESGGCCSSFRSKKK